MATTALSVLIFVSCFVGVISQYECPANEYFSQSMFMCEACIDNSTSPANSVSEESCTCIPGYYVPYESFYSCVSCDNDKWASLCEYSCGNWLAPDSGPGRVKTQMDCVCDAGYAGPNAGHQVGGNGHTDIACSTTQPCEDGLFCNFDDGSAGTCEECAYCSNCLECGLPAAGAENCAQRCQSGAGSAGGSGYSPAYGGYYYANTWSIFLGCAACPAGKHKASIG